MFLKNLLKKLKSAEAKEMCQTQMYQGSQLPTTNDYHYSIA